jgi:hypothetical protein
MENNVIIMEAYEDYVRKTFGEFVEELRKPRGMGSEKDLLQDFLDKIKAARLAMKIAVKEVEKLGW